MIFRETPLAGAWVLEQDRREDERGYFARTWCANELAAHGLNAALAQCSVSFNARAGTLRGMHYQAAPHAEAKVVRCTRGAIHDVIVDLRPESPTFRRWYAAELSEENGAALYVPEGFAHGFQTLVDATEVLYMISEFYAPESGRGVRWNDPAFGIEWPHADPRILAPRDAGYPDFAP
ncbi:MAG TPA: dTDP-4-dehydrorhamnose 3,5-epimerase [Longimicrobium sp.]|nr:dTDP-4-dehydrorhamnose 3,5-epimerase [Longimicrobium sp.]